MLTQADIARKASAFLITSSIERRQPYPGQRYPVGASDRSTWKSFVTDQSEPVLRLIAAARAWRNEQPWDDPREYDEPERSLLIAVGDLPPDA